VLQLGSRAHLEAGDADGGGAKASRSPLRKVLMWGFHTLIEVMIGTSQIKDTQCGFKLFTRETARRLFSALRTAARAAGATFDDLGAVVADLSNIPQRAAQA
jgi:hypothetical protein